MEAKAVSAMLLLTLANCVLVAAARGSFSSMEEAAVPDSDSALAKDYLAESVHEDPYRDSFDRASPDTAVPSSSEQLLLGRLARAFVHFPQRFGRAGPSALFQPQRFGRGSNVDEDVPPNLFYRRSWGAPAEKFWMRAMPQRFGRKK
ncbi:pro-FMRFamide-related neuropeptide FF [Lampetra fluviatilis]